MHVVCIGDSVTAGQYVPQGAGWVELLGWKNVGVTGDTTRLALERFPGHVQKFRPNVVVIQFGHNDANRWDTDRGLPRVSLAAFRENLVEMVDRSRHFDISPILVGLYEPRRSREYVDDCRRYNAEIHSVSVQLGVPSVGMWGVITRDHLLDDGLHLNEEGHRTYAERIRCEFTRPPSSLTTSSSAADPRLALTASSEATTHS